MGSQRKWYPRGQDFSDQKVRVCYSVRSQLPNKAKLPVRGAAGLQCSCLITVWSGQMIPHLVLHSVNEVKLPKYQSVGY